MCYVLWCGAGVVDSDDLPLNVNREALAQNRVLKVMGKKLTRKALDMLKKMADRSAKLKAKYEEEQSAKKDKDAEAEAEKSEDEKKAEEEEKREREMYDTFFKEFGKSIKLGVIDDRANKVALAKLVPCLVLPVCCRILCSVASILTSYVGGDTNEQLRYQSSKSEDGTVSLSQYVSNMPEKQDKIYYITGASVEVVKNSPMLEKLKKKGYEVLYMVDPLDEYVVQQLPEFDGKKLQSVTKDAPLDAKDKTKQEKLEEVCSGADLPCAVLWCVVGCCGLDHSSSPSAVLCAACRRTKTC
jgi:heat shock protein beta